MDSLTDRQAASAALARALVEWALPDTEPPAAGHAEVESGPPGDCADTGAPRWDRDTVLARLGGDTKFLAQMLSTFRADVGMRVAALGPAIAANDAASAHLHAVSVQLAAAKLGAEALEKVARQLDQDVVAGNQPAARRRLRQLTLAVDQLATTLGLPGRQVRAGGAAHPGGTLARG